MSLAEFQDRWHNVHGPIVAKHATTLNILRYVQDHTLDDPMNEQMAKARGGMEPPYDGVAELWWPTREALASSFGSAAGQAAGQGTGRGRSEVHRPAQFSALAGV